MRPHLPVPLRAAALCLCLACSRAGKAVTTRAADSSFAAMQDRGKMAMGVEQTTSTHTFDALADGG